MVALNDMMKSQLEMTRRFVAGARQVALGVSSALREDYQYTTLESTKEVSSVMMLNWESV